MYSYVESSRDGVHVEEGIVRVSVTVLVNAHITSDSWKEKSLTKVSQFYKIYKTYLHITFELVILRITAYYQMGKTWIEKAHKIDQGWSKC